MPQAQGYSQKRNRRADQIDMLDVVHALGRTKYRIIDSLPAPISQYEDGPHHGQDKINPHVSRFLLDDGSLMDIFHVKPIYYLHINGGWRPMNEIASYAGNHLIDLKPDWQEKLDLRFLNWLIERMQVIGGVVRVPSPLSREKFLPLTDRTMRFTVATFFPAAGTGGATVDGSINNEPGLLVYSVVRNATDGTSATPSATSNELQNGKDGGAAYRVGRFFDLYDTSALTALATLSAAVCSRKVSNASILNTDTTDSVTVATTPASNGDLTTADFDQVGTTALSDRPALSSFVFNSYVDFTLNSTGRSAISLTSISKFGVRVGGDFDNSAPTGNNDFFFYGADQTGTTSDPKLVVTYTAPNGNMLMMFGF